MRKFLRTGAGLLALALVIVSCNLLDVNPGPSPLTGPGNPGTVSVNMVVDTAIGGSLYRMLCARCHGDSAQGTSSVPHSIAGFSNIINVVRTGVSTMPAYKALSDSDVKSIEMYLAQFRQKGLDTMTGVHVFQLYCATCHGDSAQGITGRGIGIQGDSMNVTQYVRNGGKTMPKFAFVTDRQIAEIKTWLASFRLPTDGASLYKMFCASCHGDQAQGLAGKGVALQGDSANVWNYVKNGGRTMQKLSALTDVQIWQIKLYLASFPVPPDGPGLYKLYCSTCHGDSAQGLTGFGMGIQGDTANVSNYVHNGGKTMPKIEALNGTQIEQIKLFLATFILPSDGAGLFKMFCASCHGQNAEGINGSGVAIQGDTANVATFVRNGGKTMPKFSQFNDAQIALLKQFLASYAIPQDGPGLYRLYCATCHGDSAQGIINSGAGIQGDTANVTQYVRNGGKTMPKISALTNAQIALIKQFLAQFIIPTDGPSLYRLYCASCHGATAEGIVNKGPALRADSANVDVMVRNGGKTMQKFSALTAAQITAIKQYLASWAMPADGAGLFKLYCSSCHGDHAQGITNAGPGVQGDTGNVVKYIRDGGKTMPKIMALSAPQVQLVKQYLASFTLPTDGKGLYALFCSTCHGDNAQGIVGNGPGIQGDTGNVSNYVKNGGKTMPKQSQLSDAQIAQIKDFLGSFVIPTDGPALYTLYCASCHGNNAQGVINSGVAIQGDSAHVEALVKNGGKTMPKQTLTGAQITAIKTYLGSFHLPGDGPGFYQLYCSFCHGDRAQGLTNSGPGIQGDTMNVTNYVTNGGKTMPRYLSVGNPQITLIKQFLSSFVIPTDGPGLFKLYCSSCHGDSAQGITGKGPGIQRDTANVTNYVTNGGKTMPKQGLNATQIATIKDYLNTFSGPTDGPTVYKMYCATCHGDSAQGLSGPGKGPGIQRDTGNVTNYVTNGGRTMPKQPLNALQIANVKAFLMTFAMVTDGAALYTMYCFSCHGANAAGMINSGVAIQGDSANVSAMFANGGRVMPKFTSFSPLQVAGIKNYLASFTLPSTGSGFYKLYCSFCHGDSAAGLTNSGPAIQGDTINVTNYVTNGGKTMPKYLAVNNGRIALIKQFLASFIIPTDGASLYKLYCATCHGDSAQGLTGTGKGPAIQRDTANVTNYVTNGGKTMPKQPLNATQIAAVKGFLMTFAAVQDGPKLYSMYCSSCHGTSGQGVMNSGPAIQQDTTNLTTQVLNGGRTMPKITALSNAQINLVGTYIMTFSLPTDGGGLYQRYCAKCHATNALGDSVTYAGLAEGHGDIWTAVSKGYVPRKGEHSGTFPSMAALTTVTRTQSDSITAYLQRTSYTHTRKNLWIVNCMYCHGAIPSGLDGKSLTEFTSLVKNGNRDGMTASGWLSTSDIDSLYYVVMH